MSTDRDPLTSLFVRNNWILILAVCVSVFRPLSQFPASKWSTITAVSSKRRFTKRAAPSNSSVSSAKCPDRPPTSCGVTGSDCSTTTRPAEASGKLTFTFCAYVTRQQSNERNRGLDWIFQFFFNTSKCASFYADDSESPNNYGSQIFFLPWKSHLKVVSSHWSARLWRMSTVWGVHGGLRKTFVSF